MMMVGVVQNNRHFLSSPTAPEDLFQKRMESGGIE